MALQLYDLAGAESERRFSPYCWRTKLALMHKGLKFEPSRGDLRTKTRSRSPGKAVCRCWSTAIMSFSIPGRLRLILRTLMQIARRCFAARGAARLRDLSMLGRTRFGRRVFCG